MSEIGKEQVNKVGEAVSNDESKRPKTAPLTQEQKDSALMAQVMLLRRINENLENLNRKADDSLNIYRLLLQMETSRSPIKVDLGLFSKVGDMAIHPYVWGCVIADEEDQPDEDKYRDFVIQWADAIGIKVDFVGEFKVDCHDDAIKAMMENLEAATPAKE